MDRGVTQNATDFDRLLNWLDSDQSKAALKYESIRTNLIRIFSSRGCLVSDELADDTIERVTKKINDIVLNYEGDPALYFYGVARNVFREYLRKPKGQELPEKLSHEEADSEESEKRDRCLTECLAKISIKQSEFIVDYYQKDGAEKIKYRKKLAKKLGVSQKALRVRAFRVRSVLQKCLLICVKGACGETL